MSTVERIVVKKRRVTRPGDSALGVSVLSVKGWVEDLEILVELRLDSGADITLISEEFLASLPNPPRIRKGHKMSLAQLTDSGTVIKGYVVVKILMRTTTGEVAELEAEAYVVKGMSVPVLLGEDFQLTFEMGVVRNVESGTKILDRESLYNLASNLTIHASRTNRAKEHKRMKAQRRRKRLRCGKNGVKLVRASMDYRIRPQHCLMVKLEGDFSEDREWLVERSLLADTQDSCLATPNVLISARKPIIPISNISSQPKIIRKGEVLGHLVDPAKHFDMPESMEELELFVKRTEAI
ncbi:hypothetical protein B0H17DRAFT_953388 [Mycena rosella]|uniref:Peptidase A2 domain-containing protein n=1 Tax=Mycena rosella TaxID=1033263 RepID=A0AAD7G2T5_MYCRO|nr:hypothetical protein B0H17DRAFT_953388 [Mycena rosella]